MSYAAYNSRNVCWNNPDLQDVTPASTANETGARNFLTAEHRDSWSPTWKATAQTVSAASNYDFFMA